MLFIPFPFILAEIFIFFLFVQRLGFFNTLGLYLLPCFLGFLILSIVGRVALFSLQAELMRGQMPGNKILHSGAIFISGLCFLIPSFFSRVLGLILLLPGLRHLVVWRLSRYVVRRKAQRVNKEAPIVDVTPIEVRHEDRKSSEES